MKVNITAKSVCGCTDRGGGSGRSVFLRKSESDRINYEAESRGVRSL